MINTLEESKEIASVVITQNLKILLDLSYCLLSSVKPDLSFVFLNETLSRWAFDCPCSNLYVDMWFPFAYLHEQVFT